MPLNQSDEGKPRLNPEQLELAQKLKDELDKNIAPIDKPVLANNKLAELQATASRAQRQSEDEKWSEITSYNQDEIPPLAMAKLYAALPWGPSGSYLTIPQALMLAITARRRNLNPEEGDIFILPSGRIGTSLQGLLKEAKRDHKLSAPKFSNVSRPWPKGEVLIRKEKVAGNMKEIDFTMEAEPGVKVEMTIDDEPVEYTAWLREWFMGGNPNWYSRMDWMLRVRATTRVLSLGTGIAVSEEIADTDSVSSTAPGPKQEVKTPKETPFGGK